MVLRADAVRARVAKLEEVVSGLEQLSRGSSAAPPKDLRDVWAIERGLLLGAETIFDIGNHILTAHYGLSANDYEDIVVQLAAQGVIDEALRQRLTGLGGFRNILVHGYLRIDPALVEKHLEKAPAEFSDFARAIRRWLETTLVSR